MSLILKVLRNLSTLRDWRFIYGSLNRSNWFPETQSMNWTDWGIQGKQSESVWLVHRSWCQYKVYYYWLRKIKREAFDAIPAERKPKVPTVASQPSMFAEVPHTTANFSSSTAVIIRLDPFSNSLFLSWGRKCNRIKALFWEGDGFVLLFQRLEAGTFQWPRTQAEVRLISEQEFRWLMEGLSINQPKAVKKSQPERII